MKRSEAIRNLLLAKTHIDLANLYNPNMEVQVNVAQDSGERVDGDYKGRQWHGWTDGIETWKPFRIPHNARTNPEDNDYELNYNLAQHVEGIGMTGWDWRNHLSLWVAFDFDAIIGHSDSHEKKLTDAELQKIKDLVSNIPWITIRYSTGGRGLHLYVFLNPPIYSNNHNEHAALARAILGMLAGLTAFDFQSKVDTNGGNLWVYHRKMITAPDGLKLIKSGQPLSEVPINWKDHIDVVSGKSKKIVPSFIKDQESRDEVERLFDELTGQKTKIPLDESHQKLIRYLHDNNLHSFWNADLHMLVTHTHHLKKAHEALCLKGIFKTISPGTELNEHNCFAFPTRRGGWAVRRYTIGVEEATTWHQDSSGFTTTFYNQEPNLDTAAKAYGAIEHKTGSYIFREAEVAMKSASELGVHMKLPNWIMSRKTRFKEQKDGRLLVEILHDSNDRADDMEGWLAEKGHWTRIFSKNNGTINEPSTGNYDDVVRHLITETNNDYGWLIKSDRQWRVEPLVHVRTYLKSLSLKAPEVDQILGACIAKPWRLVCKPFQPEILGDRDWNRNAPQLAFAPNDNDNLNYSSWIKILNHIGKGLDDAISKNVWAKSNGIFTGADYLKCWIASLIKEPREPLPYLFFYGPQNSGKSIFHEALALLMTSGVVRADNALINSSGFNAELEGAIIGVIEETDLRKEKSAYARIKDWTTSRFLPIHRKNQTPYSVINTVKFVQMANEPNACPILPGDSRITMINVPSLDPKELIPKKQLIQMLEKEAPDFLASVLSIEIPESGDRLNVPVMMTSAKQQAEDSNRSYLEIFLNDFCYYVPGKTIKIGEFHDRFIEWVDVSEVHKWSKIRIGKDLPSKFPKGRFHAGQDVMIGNISWSPKIEGEKDLGIILLLDGFLAHAK